MLIVACGAADYTRWAREDGWRRQERAQLAECIIDESQKVRLNDSLVPLGKGESKFIQCIREENDFCDAQSGIGSQ